MVLVPVTILGGLPVIADVWFSQGDGWITDDDAGVDAIYWQKRDGTPGREISERVRGRLDKEDYWQADVTELASDWLGCHCPTRYRDHTAPGGYREEGEWSEEYIKLNGDPRLRVSQATAPEPTLTAAVCTAAPQCNQSPQARQDMRATSTVQSRAERHDHD